MRLHRPHRSWRGRDQYAWPQAALRAFSSSSSFLNVAGATRAIVGDAEDSVGAVEAEQEYGGQACGQEALYRPPHRIFEALVGSMIDNNTNINALYFKLLIWYCTLWCK